MAKKATLQVRMDAELKEQVELLYKQLGTSFAEAVRIFAKQSVVDRGMPFTMHLSTTDTKRTLGIANGKYTLLDTKCPLVRSISNTGCPDGYKIPDDIDESNDEIAEMFGVK